MITQLERQVLVRALAQEGRVLPTGFDTATTEVVVSQLKRKGLVTNGPANFPCVTEAGLIAVEETRGKELPDH
jgi:hypothetical protein